MTVVAPVTEWLWAVVAWVVSRRPIASFIIWYAQREPYTHLYGYMNRWWIFNPWNDETHVSRHPWAKFHIRIHHILRADLDSHAHNHPWWFRTIILRGWYTNGKLAATTRRGSVYSMFTKVPGDTYAMAPHEFHSIVDVSEGGVWTLVITGPKVQSWGFKTAEGVIPHDEYPSVKVELPREWFRDD